MSKSQIKVSISKFLRPNDSAKSCEKIYKKLRSNKKKKSGSKSIKKEP